MACTLVWLKAGRSHSGIILSRQGLSVGEQMRRLLRLVNRVTIKCGVMPPISNRAFPFSPKVGRVTPSAHPCSSVVELLFPG